MTADPKVAQSAAQSPAASPQEDPRDFALRTRRGFDAKAGHNKRESLSCITLTIVCTLTAPLFVTLGEGWVWGKLVPSVLSLLAAGTTAWIQLRKPQQLWALYRTCQRRIEDELSKHAYRLEGYAKGKPDRLLVERVAAIAWHAHEQWVPMLPNTDQLNVVLTSGGDRRPPHALPGTPTDEGTVSEDAPSHEPLDARRAE